MNTNLTEIAFILDRSGSMSSIASDAIGGFNAFLQCQQQQPGSANFTLVLFDNEYDLLTDGLEINKVKPLSKNTYVPRGSTALLDAIGKTIDNLGKRLATAKEENRPGKVIVAILTDGEENSSEFYSNDKISKMISHQRNNYNWEFIFLAANQDAIATASKISISAADAMNFEPTKEGMKNICCFLSDSVSKRRGK